MRTILLIVSFSVMLAGCSQSFGPGYDFNLFKNTPCWELAKAVEKEDTKQIDRIASEKKCDINFREPSFGQSLLHLAIATDKLIAVKALLENNANCNIRNLDNDAPLRLGSWHTKQYKLKLMSTFNCESN